jgi:phage terminase small subunit
MTAPNPPKKAAKPRKPAALPRARRKPHPSQNRQATEQRTKVFIECLLSNGENITQAALDAGFSPKSAASQGSRLLKKVKVRAELDRRRAELLAEHKITTDAVWRSLRQSLFFDPRKLFQESGALRPVHQLDDDTAMGLAGLEVVEMAGGAAIGGPEGIVHVPMFTKKVKWSDKNAARDQAARMLGMFSADNNQRNAGAFLEAMLNGRARAAKR